MSRTIDIYLSDNSTTEPSVLLKSVEVPAEAESISYRFWRSGDRWLSDVQDIPLPRQKRTAKKFKWLFRYRGDIALSAGTYADVQEFNRRNVGEGYTPIRPIEETMIEVTEEV
jgi:hypothetical protein